jgi:hypothetical protein
MLSVYTFKTKLIYGVLLTSLFYVVSQRVLMTLQELGIKDFTLYSPDVMAGEHKVWLSL